MTIPKKFNYSKVLEKAQTVQHIMPPGKSAAVIETDEETVKKIAEFYGALASGFTDRKMMLFKTVEEAEAWINSED